MSLRGGIPSNHDSHSHYHHRSSLQSPGLLQHGPYSTSHHPSNPLPPPVSHHHPNLSSQLSEAQTLETENRRLAHSHASMRQQIVDSQKESDSIQSHLQMVCTEIDAKMRDAYEKIKGFEGEMRVGDSLQVELHHKHVEAQALVAAREELRKEMRQVAEELERAGQEKRRMANMCKELDGLRLQHQKLRSTFEYEKATNIKQVEQMRGMEKNLISMANEIDKLRADVASAKERLQQANAAQNQAVQYQTYHQPAVQTVTYGNQGYNQGVSYAAGAHYSYPLPAYNAAYQSAYAGTQAVDGTNQYAIAGYPVPAVHYSGYEGYDPTGGAPASANKQA
ncbi:hypothetical protein LUZ60_004334 [Juncus effusus]|nr:hypothetical protein LUZ60_004334 [Juncus effusus]